MEYKLSSLENIPSPHRYYNKIEIMYCRVRGYRDRDKYIKEPRVYEYIKS